MNLIAGIDKSMLHLNLFTPSLAWNLDCKNQYPNGHGDNINPKKGTLHARFPHPNPPPESERLLAGHPGEGTNEPLREFHVNDTGKSNESRITDASRPR